jgi:hypothetical protein
MDGVGGKNLEFEFITFAGREIALIAPPATYQRAIRIESATICGPSSQPRSSKMRFNPLGGGHARR